MGTVTIAHTTAIHSMPRIPLQHIMQPGGTVTDAAGTGAIITNTVAIATGKSAITRSTAKVGAAITKNVAARISANQ